MPHKNSQTPRLQNGRVSRRRNLPKRINIQLRPLQQHIPNCFHTRQKTYQKSKTGFAFCNMTLFAFQYGPFRTPKWPFSESKTTHFATHWQSTRYQSTSDLPKNTVSAAVPNDAPDGEIVYSFIPALHPNKDNRNVSFFSFDSFLSTCNFFSSYVSPTFSLI